MASCLSRTCFQKEDLSHSQSLEGFAQRHFVLRISCIERADPTDSVLLIHWDFQLRVRAFLLFLSKTPNRMLAMMVVVPARTPSNVHHSSPRPSIGRAMAGGPLCCRGNTQPFFLGLLG